MNKISREYVKFAIIAGIIYLLLKLLPQNKIDQKDVILIVIIVLFCIFSTNYMFNNYSNYHYNIDNDNDNDIDNFQNTNQNIPMLNANQNTQMQNIPMLNANQNTQMQNVNIPMLNANQNTQMQNIPMLNANQNTQMQNIPMLNANKSDDKDIIIKKYYDTLINDLQQSNIITEDDVKIFNIKLSTKILTLGELINALELLKKQNIKVKKPDTQYNELPSDFSTPIGQGINEWDNEYSLLNTNKWQVPVQHPPICISASTPCPPCNNEIYLPLKNWTANNKISTTSINKQWANNQTDSKQ